MSKIQMKTPLVEMDGDEMTNYLAGNKGYSYSALCGSEVRIL